MARAGAFHHLIYIKAMMADTGLHIIKDPQKTALTASLGAEGVFGPEFEKKKFKGQTREGQTTY